MSVLFFYEVKALKDTKKINPKIFKRCSKILKMDHGPEKKSKAPVHRMSNVDNLHVQPKEASSVGISRIELWQLTALPMDVLESWKDLLCSPVGHGLANVRSSIYVLYGIIIYY